MGGLFYNISPFVFSLSNYLEGRCGVFYFIPRRHEELGSFKANFSLRLSVLGTPRFSIHHDILEAALVPVALLTQSANYHFYLLLNE